MEIKVKGIYVILTIQQYFHNQFIPINISYPDEIKALIKAKKAYSTDFERDFDAEFVSRKVVIPFLEVAEAKELLIDDLCLQYECETMGALTELGLLPAKAYQEFDYYSAKETQAYVSVLFDISEPRVKITDSLRSKVGKAMDRLEAQIFEYLDGELTLEELEITHHLDECQLEMFVE